MKLPSHSASRVLTRILAWATIAIAVPAGILYFWGASFAPLAAHPGSVLLGTLGTATLAIVIWVAASQIRRLESENEVISQDYEALLNITPEGVIICDSAGRITLANPQAEQLFGYAADELAGASIESLVPESIRASHARHREAFLRDSTPRKIAGQRGTLRARRKDGSEFYASISLGPLKTPQGTAVIAIVQDITAKTQHQLEVARINRALRLLSEINQIARASVSEAGLFRKICEVIVTTGGYPLAWVGHGEHDAAKSVRVIAKYGEDHGYLDRITVTWDGSATGQGSAGTAIRTGQPHVVRNTLNDPGFGAWKDAAAQSGYHSAAGFPLRIDGRTEGALVIYSAAEDAFGLEECALLEDLADEIAYSVSTLRIAASHHAAEAALRRNEATLARAQEIAHIGSWEWDLETDIVVWSTEAHHLFGFEVGEVEPSLGAVMERIHPDDRAALIEKVKTARNGEISSFVLDHRVVWDDGTLRWIHLQAEVEFHDTGPFRVVGVLQDISERKRFEQELADLASHDVLTGLPNRHLLNDRLDQGLAHHRYTERLLALVFVDLDRFKLVNDTLGHDAGDLLLKEIARRLSGCLRDGDTVARQGGDEFVVVLTDLAKAEDAAFVAQKMLDSLAPPCDLFGHEVVPAASLGIALFPRDGATVQEMMMSADKAMYAAKQAGRGQYRFFDIEMNRAAGDWLEVGALLHHALEREQFELHYQPKLDFASGTVTGVEALLRWRSPELGMVGPDKFIPILEETGRILEVGEWVIRQACQQQRLWQEQGLAPLRVAVNLSPRQFQQRDLAQRIRGIIEQEDVLPRHIELEITESMVMQNVERAIAMLGELRELGVRLAIDDFGTGYSSLAVLKRFPVDCLKVDRSFVRDIPHDADDVAITRAVILLAHSMGLSVVAEGVETEAQRAFLVECNCDEMQGYLFSRPLPADQLADLLDSKKAALAA